MASHDTDQSERPATLLGSALARVSREALAQTSPMGPTSSQSVDVTPIRCILGLNQRSCGSVVVDPRERTMTVDLKLQDGTLRHRTVIREAADHS